MAATAGRGGHAAGGVNSSLDPAEVSLIFVLVIAAMFNNNNYDTPRSDRALTRHRTASN